MSKNKRRRPKIEKVKEPRKKLSRRDIAKLLAMIITTAVVFVFYRFMLDQPYFDVVFWGYLVAATALIIGYVIYNRGFSRKGITEDMLPDTWSDEEKQSFIEDGERRLRKSRILIIPIFALLFTFAVDLLELFTLPIIQKIIQR